MIVAPSQARAIANGKVTVLRLPARPGRAGAPYARIPFKIAHDYPVYSAAARDRPKCHVRVTGKTREPLSITIMEARRSGYRTSSEFMQAWVRRYDRQWVQRHKIDLASVFGDDVVPFILCKRFEERWLGVEVWVVDLTVVDDTLYYLAQPDPTREQDDYTEEHSLAIDPLPVIDRVTQERYTRQAREHAASFKRDLERGRQEQRNARRDMLFKRVA